MVVLINKLPNFPHKTRKSKLEQFDTIALQSFNSNLSKNLHNLFLDNKNELNYATISLSWYIPCMKFMHGMHKAFAKLVKDLDYPITKWKGKLAEDYFTYTLSMLDGLNALSSLLSHVSLCKLTLSHAMNMITTTSRNDHHLKPIIVKNGKNLVFEEISSDDASFNCGKERVIHEAMVKMRGVEVLVLRVLVCGLCGEKSEEIGEVNWGEFEGFNMGFGQGFVVVKEIKEVNDVVKKVEVSLVGEKNKISEVEELKMMLSELESSTEMVVKEVNCLFSEVLARRNELINCFRLPKQV